MVVDTRFLTGAVVFATLGAAAHIAAQEIPAGAQEVRVEVVKHADGQPIHGALVTMLHEREPVPQGRFSDPAGRATLIHPRRGGYRIRVEKIGYDTWTSVVFVPTAAPTRVRAGMKPRSLKLPPVTGRTETHCSNFGDQATAPADMWGEIRKALAANNVTEEQGLVVLEIETYDRVLDSNGTIVSDTRARDQRSRLSTARLANASSSDRGALSIPDAAMLLSEDFVSTHCFTSVRGNGPETGLLGLEFKPAKLGTKPDISGVMWLDPVTYALRHIAFDFVNVPPPLRAGRVTGRVEYQALPGGEWIVSRWQIRAPRVRSGGSDTTTSAIVGYLESGGTARRVGGAAPALATAAPERAGGGTRITGSVFDATTGAPLAGVEITSTSGRLRTTTGRAGGYELVTTGDVVDTLIFDHPRLRLLRVPRARPVTVSSGGRAHLSVQVPGFEALRKTLCPAESGGIQTPGLAIGYVRDAAGNPLPGADVSASWQVLWKEEKGRLVAARENRSAETTTAADGSYVLCGFTRDAPVVIRVATAGRAQIEERITLPRTMVLEREFRVPGQ